MALNADARSSDSPTGLLSTMRLGKYRIERQLGAGGMGTVFLAVDSELRRTVALKVLPKERAANPQLVRRFKSEGQSAARLEHENIVKVFEAGEIDGYLYLALEYIDGIDVQELVRKRGLLPIRRSIEIVSQVAAALQHASERGIVHRDIKPSNLLIRKDGVVKLADMGLARVIDETIESSITHAGMTVGTVNYISPEQGSDSKQADIRSDLYSLGCSWFHMLTGEVPFPEGTAVEKLRAHGIARIPDPRQFNERIPAAVVAVLQRLMAKKPENRYQTPQELIDDLKQPSLLRHETGAADLAGLALADSETDESPDETNVEPDGDTTHGNGTTRRTKPGKPDKNTGRRQTRRSDGADSDDPPSEDSDGQHPDPRRVGARRPNTKPSGQRGTARSDGKAKRAGATHGSKDTRDLPPRSERPERFAVNHSMIDPDTLRVAGFGLLVLVVVSLIGWMMWRGSQDRGGSLVPAGANPFARAEGNAPPPTPTVVSKPPKAAPAGPTPTEITNFRAADPFPGARDVAADSGATDVPSWVYEARAHTRSNPQTVVVDPTGTKHHTLAEALSALPKTGGIIELRGRGPFAVHDWTLSNGQDVLVRAADGSQPVLHLADTAGQIRIRGGRLELNGVHLVASGRGRSANNPLIDAIASTVLIRNSSITLAAPAPAAVPAVALQSEAGTPSRCVFENVCLSGANLTAAALIGPAQEFVAGNCFINSGAAPAVSIVEPGGDSIDPATDAATVELLQSIVISRSAVFQCEQRTASSAPAVRLRVRHAVFEGSGPEASALRFPAWPETPSSVLDQPRATGVRLIAEHAVWAGWPQLTVFQPSAGGEPVSVANEAQWLQFWRSPLSSGSGAAELTPPLQAALQPVDVRAELSRFAQQLGPDVALDAFLDAAALPQLPDSLIARLVADSARPRVPDNLDAAFTGPEVKLDLAKNGLKLNRVLNGPDCPDGARVVLTASKKVVIEPVVLQGKSLRLEFDTGNEPLVIEPRTLAGVDRPAALFRVEGGRLDLVNARLRIPPSESSSYPLRLLQVVDGSFAVRRCILLGQFGTAAQDVPTIEWEGGDDPSRFGLIEDSLVAGQSQAIGGEVRGQLLEVRNSIIASGGNCVRLSSMPAKEPATLHLARCTLSGAKALFWIDPPTSDAASREMLLVFVDHCVYGPPLIETADPLLFAQSDAEFQLAPVNVNWWENRTAISDRINRKRIERAGGTGRQPINENWSDGWGDEHVNDSVSGSLAVILAAKQIDLTKPQPADFQLDPKSAAASAATDGGPLGARIDSVGPHRVDEAAPAKRATPAPKTPTTPRPGF